jgi:hypothetical protein
MARKALEIGALSPSSLCISCRMLEASIAPPSLGHARRHARSEAR